MMKLGVAVLALATLGKVYSSDVVLEFRPNDNYFVQCGNNSGVFTNTNELSSGMNSVTSPYLCSTSVEKNDDIVTFNGVYNLEPCELKLRSTAECKPKLVFKFENNTARFSRILIEDSIPLVDFNVQKPIIDLVNKIINGKNIDKSAFELNKKIKSLY